MLTGVFDLLTPHVVLTAVEQGFGFRLNGTMTAYPSYINRVYGLGVDDGPEIIVKFYRPGRWSVEAIGEEHQFLQECAQAEIPVVPPVADEYEETMGEAVAASGDEEETFPFAVFPKRAGRNFDAEGDEDWYRLGTLVGRIHAVGRRREAPKRTVCLPTESTERFVEELLHADLVHPECRQDFEALCRTTTARIAPLFNGVRLQRIHGDCHRGNILERPGEGLVIVDFDDMMSGPPVQDLWLLLPGYARDCRRELVMILEGYEEWIPFERATLRLIEPLRFMRMIYFLAWCARQRHDRRFRIDFPQWGGEAFWVKELEDLRTQVQVIEETLAD